MADTVGQNHYTVGDNARAAHVVCDDDGRCVVFMLNINNKVTYFSSGYGIKTGGRLVVKYDFRF
ncbi:MAG: hypothetical protein RLZZ630_510 [Bacteroidota bacterium]